MDKKFSKNENNTTLYKKVSDLQINKKYLITNAEYKDTRYGKSVQMTVKENGKKIKFFLPKRFNNEIKECDLNSYLYQYIVYEG